MTLEEQALYQSALLDELHRGGAPEEILARLKARPELVAFRQYLDSIEPRMIAVGVALVARWGER